MLCCRRGSFFKDGDTHESNESSRCEKIPVWCYFSIFATSSILLAASLVAFHPATTYNLGVNGFFMDDVMIHKNAVVVSDTLDRKRLLRTDYWGLEMFDGSWTHKSFRPFTVLVVCWKRHAAIGGWLYSTPLNAHQCTFRWNHLLHGFSLPGFHVTNVALHAVAGAQLGLLGCHVLGSTFT